MDIVFTDGTDPRFVEICNELDDYLNLLAGGEENRKQYVQYNTLEHVHDVVLIVENGVAAACGGFRDYLPGMAEMKRVFTRPQYRRRGYAKTVIAHLEQRAKAKGYGKVVLETGAHMQSAIAMYQSQGYRIIPNYGQYVGMSESVCLEKQM